MICACTKSTDLFALCQPCFNRAWNEGQRLAERDRAKPWPDYDASADLSTDGRNLADWDRRIVGPQMRAIQEQHERAKPQKRR